MGNKSSSNLKVNNTGEREMEIDNKRDNTLVNKSGGQIKTEVSSSQRGIDESKAEIVEEPVVAKATVRLFTDC